MRGKAELVAASGLSVAKLGLIKNRVCEHEEVAVFVKALPEMLNCVRNVQVAARTGGTGERQQGTDILITLSAPLAQRAVWYRHASQKWARHCL